MMLWRFLRRSLLVCVAAVLLYLMAALVLAFLPVNHSWRPSEQGVTVWLGTNGVHAALAFPANAAGVDWFAMLPPEQVLELKQARPLPADFDHISFGWGDRRFFIETPQWSDLKLSTALWAASGQDDALMHVEYLGRPQRGSDFVPIVLSVAQYRQLAVYVRDAFALDARGRTQQLAGRFYGQYDRFFEAHGHYSLLFTCNEWVRQGLMRVGVRTPTWTPFDRPLFWQLQAVAGQ